MHTPGRLLFVCFLLAHAACGSTAQDAVCERPGDGPCPEGCREVFAHRFEPSTCQALQPVSLCLREGEAPSTERPTAYVGDALGENVIVRDPSCAEDLFAMPQGLTECGGVGEPDLCRCVCGGGTCPGDSAVEVLETCGLPRPCGDVIDAEADADAARCLLEHLRDRIPMRAELELAGTRTAFAVGADGTMTATTRYRGDVCPADYWHPPLSCELRPGAEFEQCLQAGGDLDPFVCLHPIESWGTCVLDFTPRCPG